MGRRAFTLVEILIVVVILGILAAIIVPLFTNATEESAEVAARTELQKLRNHLGVYYARHREWPDVVEGDGTWGQIVGTSDYLQRPPLNPWVGGAASRTIVFGNEPDAGYQTTHGWIYNPVTGEVWAGAFDLQERPFPRE